VPDECSCYYSNSGYSSSSKSGRSQIRVIKQAGDPGYTAQICSLMDNLVQGCGTLVHGSPWGFCQISPHLADFTSSWFSKAEQVLLQEWLVICYNEPDRFAPRSPETGHA
jgi:hypothetical protein